MNVRPFAPLLALGTAACGAGSLVPGLWVIQIGASTSSDTESDCRETFDNASCPSTDAGDSEYTTTSEADESNGYVIVEILEGPGGEKALVRDGLIYPGLQEGKTVTFSLERFENGSTTVEHESGDWTSRSSIDGTLTETYTLERGAGNIWTGSWSITQSVMRMWSETDEWDPTAFDSPPFSRMPTEILEAEEDTDGFGFVENDEDENCSSSNCEIELTTSGSSSAEIPSAWQVGNVALEERGGFSENETPSGLPFSDD